LIILLRLRPRVVSTKVPAIGNIRLVPYMKVPSELFSAREVVKSDIQNDMK